MNEKEKAKFLAEVTKLIRRVGSHKPKPPLRSPFTLPSSAERRKKWRLINGRVQEIVEKVATKPPPPPAKSDKKRGLNIDDIVAVNPTKNKPKP